LPTKPVRSIILLAGRRAGKDRFLSAVACWRAALACDWSKYQSAGEGAVVILLGADRKQAAILRKYCRGLLQVPLLKAEVVRDTDDLVEFKNGASLEIATNDARLVRGRSAIAILGSECCYWRVDEHSSSSDEEVVAASEPSLSMCEDGGLMMLGSSVYRKRGYMYRRYGELHGNDDDEDICWFATSPTMNPKLPMRVIEKALAKDKRKAEAEYLNIFRDDLSECYPDDAIMQCTDRGIFERAPRSGVKYFAFHDAAGGTGKDSFTLAISHREATYTLDAVRERKPRFVPAVVIGEYAQLLKTYRISEVHGDKFAGGFNEAEWKTHGIKFVPAEKTKSEIYLSLLPLLLAGRTRLLDNATLRSQLSSLERSGGSAGHERVDHPAHASAHDDVANAVAGALVLAAKPRMYDVFGPWLDNHDTDAPSPPARLWPGMSLEREQQIASIGMPSAIPWEYVKQQMFEDHIHPKSVSPSQLRLVQQAAATLRRDERDAFLQGVAKHLGHQPSDAAVAAAVDAQLPINRIPSFAK
jgi:hypothetical protein